MDNIAPLHHISQGDIANFSHVQQIEAFCKAGGTWTQLRIKNESVEYYLHIAHQVRAITQQYNCKLIINDNVEIAKACHADGIHLGKSDRTTEEARSILGAKKIIGRTCNSFEDILFVAQQDIQYIGLGPLRFTSTKDALSPILGIEGYRLILNQCKAARIDIPIIAIGGVSINDIANLRSTGVYGVAMASVINKSKDTSATIHTLQEALER